MCKINITRYQGNHTKGFIMLSLLLMLLVLAWPLQQLMQTTDFLLQQNIALEAQQQAYVANGQAKLKPTNTVTSGQDDN